MKLKFLFPAVLVGLATGCQPVGATFGTKSRSEAMVELFEQYCLPFARKESDPPLDKLVPFSGPTDRQYWMDETSLVLVAFDERHCLVSDELEHLSEDERALVQRAAAMLVQFKFPELERVTNHGLDGSWDHYAAWTQYELGDPRRWGIMVHRFAKTGEQAQTTLQLTLGQSPN